MHIDDTNITILEIKKQIEEEVAHLGSQPIRTGIHTTNVTVNCPEGKIVLYKSGLHHAGEILAQILFHREDSEKIIVMPDALAANFSKIEEKDAHIAKCNSHAFRRFKDNALLFSKALDPLIKKYGKVFKNEKEAKKRNLKGKERLEFHRENSLPLMESIKITIEKAFKQKKIEPNSICYSTG